MTSIKTPRSLRTSFASVPTAASLSLVAAACVAVPDSAQGQSGPTALPTMNVEAAVAPKPRRAPPRKPQPRRAAHAHPVPATVSPAAAIALPTFAQGPATANANPYAAPGVPYKVERSASSKLTEPLVDTARTITAIPKEVIEDKGATSIRELVRTTPGLTLGTGEGGNAFGDRVFIRGFDARNDMYINGIRESGVSTRETFMTEQVEVIKGPAGSIAGRGTAGGAINIVTKQPTPVDFTEVEMKGGTDRTRRVAVDVNRNITPDLAIRANGLFHQSEVAGRDHVFDNRYGGSFAARWRPSQTFKATLDYYDVTFDSMPDWGVPFDPRTRRPFTESGLRRSTSYSLTQRDFQHNAQHLSTMGFEWQVDPSLLLTSKFRFGQTNTDYLASKPGAPDLSNPNPLLWTVPATPASRYQVNRTLANQTEATWTGELGGVKHTVVAGLEAQRENISQDSYTGLAVECNPACTNGAVTNLWTSSTSLISPALSPTRAFRPMKTDVNTLSAYALDTLNWTDRLFLNLGARADHYAITRAPFGATAYGRDDLLFAYNLGLTYKLLPNASLYAAYATSSNPTGSELDAGGEDYGGLTATNVVFRPEANTSLEVGTKWELFEKRLLLTGALFQTTKTHARETLGSGTGAVLQDSAAYRIRGVELGATGNVTERWSVFGGIVWMRSEVTESAIPANIGRPLANIAHLSFNLLSKFHLTDQLWIGGQGTYRGEILGGTLAATVYAPGTVNVGGSSVATPGGYNKLPGGWRFDLLAEYQINKTLSAKLQVLNIFDKVLYDAFYRSSLPYVYVAPGRSGYLTLTAKF